LSRFGRGLDDRAGGSGDSVFGRQGLAPIRPPDLPPGPAPPDLPLGICPWDLPLGPAATSDREPDTPDGSERDGKAVGGGTGHAGEKSIHQDRAVELSFCLCDRIEKFI
jgi:hypothetical protein